MSAGALTPHEAFSLTVQWPRERRQAMIRAYIDAICRSSPQARSRAGYARYREFYRDAVGRELETGYDEFIA